MKNLAQIRAQCALEFAQGPAEKRGKDGGDAIKKIPPMIATNGLLAAVAFSLEKKNNNLQRPGYAAIFDAIARHLSSSEIAICDATHDAEELLQSLIANDSEVLKLATSESMEWLAFARRFVTQTD